MFEASEDIDVDDDFFQEAFENDQIGFDTVTTRNYQNEAVPAYERGSEFPSCGIDTVGIPQFLNRPNCSNSKPTSPEKRNSNSFSKTLGILRSDENNHTPNSNKENKRKLISSHVPSRTKRERKFPGPAGLLPDRKLSGGTPLKLLDSILETEKSTSNSPPDELCSQGRCSGSVLEDEPWQSLLADLGPDRSILDLVNVANVKRKAAAKCFVGKKVPFLAVVLHHLDVSSPDPCVILRDGTGEIHGTLHREVWDQFAGDLIVGSVLVVRNVGLLSTGLSSRRHYLNITANNLVTIYSASSDKYGKPRLQTFSRPDFNQIIEHWKTLVSPSHGMGSPAAAASPTLFNSSFGSLSTTSPVQGMRNLNTDGHLPRRTVLNQKSNITPENVKPRFVQNLHSSTPRASETIPCANLKTAGKNLIPSFTSNTQQNSSVCVSLNGVVDSKLLNSTKPLPNKFVSSFSVNSNLHHSVNSSNSTCTTKMNTTPNTFNFSPVSSVSSNKPSSELFSNRQSNFNLTSHQQLINKLNCETNTSAENNNSKLTATQTSELSAEEQSMVESVFDGIDADSIFDDDF